MKLALHTTLLAVAVFALSCGKSVSGRSSAGGSSVRGDGDANSGDNDAINSIRDELSAVDKDLLSRIQDEERARIEADNKLQAQIDDIKIDLDNLKKATDEKLAEINIQINLLGGKIATATDNLYQALEALGLDVKAQIGQVETRLRAYIDAEIGKVNTRINNVDVEIVAIKERLTKREALDLNQLSVLRAAGIINQAQYDTLLDGRPVAPDQVPNIASQLTSLSTRLSQLNNEFLAHKQAVATELTSIKTRLTANERLSGYQADIMVKMGVITQAQRDMLVNGNAEQAAAVIASVPNIVSRISGLETGLTALRNDFQRFKDVEFAALAQRVSYLEVIGDVLRRAGIINAEQRDALAKGTLNINTVGSLTDQIALLATDVANVKKTVSELDMAIQKLQSMSAAQLNVFVQTGLMTTAQKDALVAGTLDISTLANIAAKMGQLLDRVGSLETDVAGLKSQYTDMNARILANQAMSDAQLKILVAAGILTQAQADAIKANPSSVDTIMPRTSLIASIEERLRTLAAADVALENRQNQTADKLDRLENELIAFKRLADEKYATKADLLAVKTAVEGLQSAVAVMNGDVQNLKAKLSPEFLALITRLESDVGTLKTNVADLRGDFDGHMELYHTEFANVATSVADAINQVRSELNGRIDNLGAVTDRLNDRIVELETYMQAGGALDQRLIQLKSDSVRMADQSYRDAVAYVDQKNAQMRADMASEKQGIQNQINALTEQLAQVALVANSAKWIAQDNATRLTSLSDRVTTAEQKITGLQQQMSDLRNDMQVGLQNVRNYSSQAVASLGSDMQQRFADVNTRMAQLENKVANIVGTLAGMGIPSVQDMAIIRDMEEALKRDNAAAVQAVYDMRLAEMRMEEEFINAIDPVNSSRGVDSRALNLEFRNIAGLAVCNGFVGGADDISSIQDKEWFFHLARGYAKRLVTNPRSGNPWENIFFSNPKLFVNDNDLKSLVLVGSVEQYDIGSKAECHRLVDEFINRRLLGADGATVRAAITSYPDFRAAVGEFYVKAFRADTAMTALLNTFREMMRRHLGTWQSVDAAIIAPIGEDASPVVQLANFLLEQSSEAAEMREIQANREQIIALQREYARMSAKEAELDAKLNQLNTALADFKNITTLKLTQLTGAAQTSFSLIAAIARRLGYEDLVRAAAEATAAIGGTLTQYPDPAQSMCSGVQHYYNHVSQSMTSKAGGRCWSLVTLTNRQLDSSQLTKCAIHGSYGDAAYTWGNETLVANGWNASGQIGDNGQLVSNGLTFPRRLAPDNAEMMRLRNLPRGSTWAEQQGKAALVFRIFGNFSDRIKVDVKTTVNGSTEVRDPYSVIVSAAPFKIAQTVVGSTPAGVTSPNTYDVPLNDAIGRLSGCRTDREARIVAVRKNAANQDEEVGSVCVHRFHTFSPIVLDLAAIGHVETINPLFSKASFDLDGNGREERTGWLTKSAGLLAIDLNGNGRIDSGRELFGEATRLADGTAAANGYAAMAQYDSNHDGMIDSQEAVFSMLRVWQDVNEDGVSASYELKKLSDLGITSLATGYTNVPAAKVVQDHGGLPEGNIVKFESRYYGPKSCGAEGCKSFDVYFGSNEAYSVSAAH